MQKAEKFLAKRNYSKKSNCKVSNLQRVCQKTSVKFDRIASVVPIFLIEYSNGWFLEQLLTAMMPNLLGGRLNGR